MKKILLIVAVIISAAACAQQKPVQYSFETGKSAAGKYQLIIKAKIAAGVKLLSTDSIKGLEGVQTIFQFDTASLNKIDGLPAVMQQPKKEKATALGGIEINYFTDSVTWIQNISVAKGDSFRIKGKVISYLLNGEEVQNFSDDISKEFIYKENNASVKTDSDKGTSFNKSLLGWLIGGILAGLIGFLTPCVYPLVPVTVGMFLKRSKTPAKGRAAAITYTLLIVAIYAAIGLLVYAFGGGEKLNVISTSWPFNLFVFFLFLLFGISFLGAFEITLPGSWATKLDSKSNIGNIAGLFFMALTFVVVSFSCTGNFIAAAFGIKGPATLFALTGFGIGLALPFTLFAFFPAWLKEMSKPGGWQNALKVSLGILEIALAMKFLSNVDVQLGKYWFARDIYLAIWIALFSFLTIYLLGGFSMKHDSELPKNDWGKTYIPIPRFFFALLSLSFTIYLIPGLWGAPLNKISGLLPPYGTQEYTGNNSHSVSTANTFTIKPAKYVNELIKNESAAAKNAGLVTFFDYDEAMAAAKEQGKPLIIDFTGIVCANCREFENRVWTKPEVMERMKNKFVVASLFEDFAQELPDVEKRYSELLGSPINTVGDKFKELSIKLTGGVSQPNYVFLDHAGNKLSEKGYGYDDVQKNGTDDFVKHLDKVLEIFGRK